MADADNESDNSFESADEGESVSPVATKEERSDLVEKKGNKEEKVEKEREKKDPQVKLETEKGNTSEKVASTLQEVSLDSSGEDRPNSAKGSKSEPQQETAERTEQESNTENENNSKKEAAEKVEATEPSSSEREEGYDNSTNTELENTETEIASKEPSSSPANQSIDRTNVSEGTESAAPETPPAGQGSWGSWGGGGWSGWGSSLLTSATATVSAVSGSVGKVIENVESSLGVPKPEDIKSDTTVDEGAKTDDKEEETKQESDEQAATSPGGTGVGSFFSYGASAFSSVVGKTVSGGLDALEVIGKKTMDVLQDGDPGLRKTREYFQVKRDGPNLSRLLREAKEDADERAQLQEEEDERQKCHFGWLFEQNQGLAHLEALEILSNESETRVEAVVGGSEEHSMEALKTELMEIKDAFELEDVESEETDESEDFVNTITEHLFSLSVAATPDKLKRVQSDAHQWLTKLDNESEDAEVPDAKEIHVKAMQVLADLTARSIEQFHKTGELLLLKQVTEENKSPIQQATSLSKLTSALCAEVSFVASKFSEKLSKIAASSPDSETVNGYVTNIFLEASNSTSYIQDAFQLLLPVMQVVAIDQKENP